MKDVQYLSARLHSMQLNVPQAKITIDKWYFSLAQEMIQSIMLWGGECQKCWKFKRKRGMGTNYQNKAKLIPSAIVAIFRIILIAAATVTVFGNNSSCYGPQPWELHPRPATAIA